MNCISEIKNEAWFNSKPWLICGTGESLNRFTPDMIDKYNIWTIYCSIDVTGYADVFQYQDVYINYYDGRQSKPMPTNYRYSATRPLNHMIEVDGKIVPTFPHAIPLERKKYIYYQGDIDYNGVKQPENAEIFLTSNSTSFAFWFLARMGVKEIYSLGIQDGSTGVAKGINEGYTTDFYEGQKIGEIKLDKENSCNKQWCDQYGATWIKL